jgi:hypothetical protein
MNPSEVCKYGWGIFAYLSFCHGREVNLLIGDVNEPLGRDEHAIIGWNGIKMAEDV